MTQIHDLRNTFKKRNLSECVSSRFLLFLSPKQKAHCREGKGNPTERTQ